MTWKIIGDLEALKNYDRNITNFDEAVLKISNDEIDGFAVSLVKYKNECQLRFHASDESENIIEDFFRKRSIPISILKKQNEAPCFTIETLLSQNFYDNNELKMFLKDLNNSLFLEEEQIPEHLIKQLVDLTDLKSPELDLIAFKTKLSHLKSEETDDFELDSLCDQTFALAKKSELGACYLRCLSDFFTWCKDNGHLEMMLKIYKATSINSNPFATTMAYEVGHTLFLNAITPDLNETKKLLMLEQALETLFLASFEDTNSILLVEKILQIIQNGKAEIKSSDEFYSLQQSDKLEPEEVVKFFSNQLFRLAKENGVVQEENKKLRETIARQEAKSIVARSVEIAIAYQIPKNLMADDPKSVSASELCPETQSTLTFRY